MKTNENGIIYEDTALSIAEFISTEHSERSQKSKAAALKQSVLCENLSLSQHNPLFLKVAAANIRNQLSSLSDGVEGWRLRWGQGL